MTAMNVIATARWTVGVFAALYAGLLDPSVRVTCQHPCSIDHRRRRHHHDGRLHRARRVSGMTDDVIDGKIEEIAVPARGGVAGREQIGGDADCAVLTGAVGGGDCGGGEKGCNTKETI